MIPTYSVPKQTVTPCHSSTIYDDMRCADDRQATRYLRVEINTAVHHPHPNRAALQTQQTKRQLIFCCDNPALDRRGRSNQNFCSQVCTDPALDRKTWNQKRTGPYEIFSRPGSSAASFQQLRGTEISDGSCSSLGYLLPIISAQQIPGPCTTCQRYL